MWKKIRFLFDVDDDGGASKGDSEINPPVNVEDGEEGKEFVSLDTNEEEVIYVDDESQIPNEEKKPEEVKKPGIEELLAKQAEMQNKTLMDLGQVIAKGQQPGIQQVQQPQMSDEDFEKEYTKIVYTDPVKARKMYDRRYLAPVVGQVIERNSELQFKLAKVDPETKDLFDEYGDEISEAYSRLSPQQKGNPTALKGVLNDVRNNHFKDMAQKFASELLEDKLKEMAKAGTISKTSSKGTTFVSGGGVQGGRSTGTKKVYKVKPPAWVAQSAERIGMSADDYFQVLKENNDPRLKK